MSRTIRFFALTFLAAALVTPLRAEPTAGPPAWQDGASVYLGASQQGSPDDRAITAQAPAGDATSTTTASFSDAPPKVDYDVARAVHQAPNAPPTDRRRLAPPSQPRASGPIGDEERQGNQAVGASRRIANFGVPLESIYTILTALAVVIGAFLLFAWLLRRGGRAMARRGGNLPADVVSVLGRVPLAARQFAELLRVGNKLVLVSLTPTGAETLTEVTDPVEVDRLLGLCQQHNPHSTTKAFEQVFRQLSSEPAPSGFLGSQSLPPSLSSPAGAYRAQRGDMPRG